jgi:hypothetical protein
VCGAVEDIVVHHRDGDRGNNAIENLIPLCETCHGKVHGRSDDVPELVRDLGYRPTGDGDTTLRIREELADELYSRKSRGESYEDVIWRLIDPAEGGKAEADRDDDREVPHTPDAVETPDVDDVRTQLKDVTFPSTKERDTCIAAVVAAREYLREYESASMRDFVTDVMPDHPIGYSVPDLEPGERYRGSWWRKVVKPALTALPDVEAPPSGGSDWRYTGGTNE